MGRWIRPILAFGFLMGLTAPMRAGDDITSGNYWIDLCTKTSGEPFCLAYIKGIADFNMLIQKPMWCAPPEVTIGQLAKVVVKEVQVDPAFLHLPFVVLAREALAKNYPCPENGVAAIR